MYVYIYKYIYILYVYTHIYIFIYVYIKSDPYIYCKLPGWALFFVVQRFTGHRERSYLTEHGSMEPMYEDKEGVLPRGCMLK